jgi:hypothetical protein
MIDAECGKQKPAKKTYILYRLGFPRGSDVMLAAQPTTGISGISSMHAYISQSTIIYTSITDDNYPN